MVRLPKLAHPRKNAFRSPPAARSPTPRRRIRRSFPTRRAHRSVFSDPRRAHRHVGRPRRRRAGRPARFVPPRRARHVVGPAAPGVSHRPRETRATTPVLTRTRTRARRTHPFRGVRVEHRRRRGVRARGARQGGLGARTFPRLPRGSRGGARRDAPRFPALRRRARRARQPRLAREAHKPRCMRGRRA